MRADRRGVGHRRAGDAAEDASTTARPPAPGRRGSGRSSSTARRPALWPSLPPIISVPVSMKNGIAISGKLCTCATICCTARCSGTLSDVSSAADGGQQQRVRDRDREQRRDENRTMMSAVMSGSLMIGGGFARLFVRRAARRCAGPRLPAAGTASTSGQQRHAAASRSRTLTEPGTCRMGDFSSCTISSMRPGRPRRACRTAPRPPASQRRQRAQRREPRELLHQEGRRDVRAVLRGEHHAGHDQPGEQQLGHSWPTAGWCRWRSAARCWRSGSRRSPTAERRAQHGTAGDGRARSHVHGSHAQAGRVAMRRGAGSPSLGARGGDDLA